MTRITQVFLRIIYWVTVFVGSIFLCVYLSDAHMRSTGAPNCSWSEVANAKNAPYSARFCYLNKEVVLLRLYDASATELLAERTYLQLDRPFISWDSDRLWYDTYPDGSFIALPPSLFERLRAKLP